MRFTPLVLLNFLVASSFICNGYKILVIFPSRGRSHVILGDGVVRHLLNAGHEVTYVTSTPKNETNFNLKYIDVGSIKTKRLINMGSILNNEWSPSRMRSGLPYLGNWLATTALIHENFQKLLADPKEHFDLVIGEWFYDELYSTTAAVFNAPFIWLSTIEPHSMILSIIDESLNPSYNGFSVPETTPFTFWDRVLELWFTVKMTVTREIFTHYIQEREYKKLVAPHIEARGRIPPSFEELKYNASLVFGNSYVSMGEATRLPQNYKSIGGYHINDETDPLPQNLKEIIDSAEHGVIYFNVGSRLKITDLPYEIKTSLLKMFATLKQTVLWKFDEMLPDCPKNVYNISWAPQQSILAHPNVILFITHGGQLSITETIHAGKPIVGIPVFTDQFLNVARAVGKGFAKKVDLSYNLAEDLKIAIDEVLGNPKFAQKAKEMQFIHHDRLIKPGQELVHWAEHVIKTQGAPHLRSPALLLPWYQKIYLDLLAVIIILFILLRYVYSLVVSVFVIRKSNTKRKKL